MKIKIAIDAMGGDFGVPVTVAAALYVLDCHPEVSLVLVGDTPSILLELENRKSGVSDRLSIQHCTQVVAMDEQPQFALKNKKDSSMRVAINLIKLGQADACVSAGNTGALVATARFVLKTLQGIDRPAIASAFPCKKGDIYLLDLGANVDCTPEHLLQFALMGSALASCSSSNACPSIGILNVGTETIKGNEVVKRAGELLRASHLNFHGNVEGTDIYAGTTDVVVCDGFVGNVMLKTSEGLAKMMGAFLKDEFQRNWIRRGIALLAMPALKSFRRRLDPRRYNGASLLGLQGIVVKSHGGADAYAYRYAIETAIREVSYNLLNKIREHLSCVPATVTEAPTFPEQSSST